MSREIKFRVQRRMLDLWNKYIETKWEIVTLDEGFMDKDNCLLGTLGQFTGLKDKNGVDIYDGDKVKFIHESNYCNEEALCEEDWNYGTVVWGGSYPAFDIDNHSEDYNLLSSPEYTFEVIGNIHEENTNE